MLNPEYPINISLPENKNILRQAVGKGVDQIDALKSSSLLADPSFDFVLQRNFRWSKDRDLHNFIPRLRFIPELGEEGRDVIHLLLPPAPRAARYISYFATNMKEACGTEASLTVMETNRTKDIEGMMLFYDFGVGMDIVSSLIESYEGIKSYDETEGIDDPIVNDVLERYTRYPSQVIHDAVAAHIPRFTRSSEEVGIYVPEFVTAGMLHGETLFTTIYEALSS